MFPFHYVQPRDLAHALELLQGNTGDICLMAGGTDLLLRFRSEKCNAKQVLSLDLPELKTIEETEDQVIIGACVGLTQIIDHFEKSPEPFAMLARCAASVGACQTRNMATIGGNFCTGNASADIATALLAANASVVIQKAGEKRVLPIDKLFVSNRNLAISPEEIVTHILIPRPKVAAVGAEFIKVGKRRGHVIAVLNVAGLVQTDAAGAIEEIFLAAGTLAPTPIRLYKCEEAARGKMPTEELLEELSAIMLTEIHPRDSLRASKEYRLQVAPAILRRVIRASAGMEAVE